MIDIIMATHNHLNLTMEAVECLYAHTVNPFKLIVVDDSSDKTLNLKSVTLEWLEWWASEHDNMKIIHSDKPYTHGNQIIQIGLDHAETSIVGYLGNSTRVEPEWDGAALEIMEREESIGVMGFKLVYEPGQIEHAGMYWTPDMPHHYNFGVNQPGHRLSFIREVPAVGWALVLFRKLALPEKLDVTTYHGFRGYDDLDTCFEITKRGWKIVYCGLGAAYHSAGATRHANVNEDYIREQEENRITFLKKWGADEKSINSQVITTHYG